MKYTSKKKNAPPINIPANGFPVRKIFFFLISLFLLSFFAVGVKAQHINNHKQQPVIINQNSVVSKTLASTITIAITSGSNTICAGASVTFTATASGGSCAPNFTYQWYKNGVLISGQTSITYTTTTLANGDQITCQQTNATVTCTVVTSSAITVTVNPKPAITAMTSTVCSATGFTVTPVNITNGIVPAGTTYSWSAPTVTGGITGGASGTNAANISGTLTNPTNTAQTATYTVTPTSGTCTGSTFTVIVTVNPKPAITAMTSTVCSATGFTVTPVNITNGIVPAGTTYSWSAPTVTGGITGGASGTNAANISGTLTNPTNTAQTATYTVTPTSGTCTGSIFTVTVTVNPKPAITAMTSTVCSATGFTVTPVNITNGIVPAGTTY